MEKKANVVDRKNNTHHVIKARPWHLRISRNVIWLENIDWDWGNIIWWATKNSLVYKGQIWIYPWNDGSKCRFLTLEWNILSVFLERSLGLKNRLEMLHLEAGSPLRKLLQEQDILAAFLGKKRSGGMVALVEMEDLLAGLHGVKGRSHIKLQCFQLGLLWHSLS